jgi:LysR family transcriptional regulator, glycine cleavage system transcriptional activator
MDALPSTQSLRAFEACGRLLSCTRAAEELFMTPGAVSKQLRSLETTLGLQLFVRTGQGLLLTPAGTSYLANVQPLLARLAAAATLAHTAGSSRRTLLLHVLPTLADKWLLPRYPDFQEHHPEVNVQFTNLMSSDGVEQQADASFRYGEGVWAGQEAVYLVGRRLRLVASPALLERAGSIKRPQDITRHTLLQHFELPTAWQELFHELAVQPKVLPPTIRYGFFSVLIRGALTGMGLALIPEVLIVDELRSGALVNVNQLSSVSRRGYYLVYPKERRSDEALAAFRDWVVELARQTETEVYSPRRTKRPRIQSLPGPVRRRGTDSLSD